jgi:hypothetical protein
MCAFNTVLYKINVDKMKAFSCATIVSCLTDDQQTLLLVTSNYSLLVTFTEYYIPY